MYLWDADRSSWSRPISLYEVTLVSRQQVILHCFYEEIFTSVVVLYQSFFLYNLKQGSDFIQDEDTVDFCWVLSLSVSGGISKCNNSFHQVPLLLQYLFKMWQQWQRHEHYRWEAREKKKLRGKPVSCVWLEQKKKTSAAERFACRHTNCSSWPTNTMTNVLHKDEQTVIYFSINSS